MNRRTVFGAIAGVLGLQGAAAQIKLPTEAGCATCGIKAPPKKIGEESICVMPFSCGVVKPDQCPVCGEIAEPFVRPTRSARVPQYNNKGEELTIGIQQDIQCGPMEHFTACKRCSNVFQQIAAK